MRKISKYSYQLINSLSHKPETPVSRLSLLKMKTLSKKNRITISTDFMYNELPIRLVHRIKDLEELPLQLDNDHEIFQVRDNFIQSLHEITAIAKPQNISECEKFRDVVDNIYARHNSTLVTMAKGIIKLKKNNEFNENTDIDNFLSNFYLNRTKTRILIDNYLKYYIDNENIGIFNTNLMFNRIVEDAVNEIESLADIHRYDHPTINYDMQSKSIVYAEDYLHYPLVEILKNALVATRKEIDPTINISTYNDNNIIILKISDNGSGIDNEDMKNIWKFSFTTYDVTFSDNYSNDFEMKNPLAGFGYGLPISKILLNVFYGNIKVFSEKGKGTDVYLFIDLNSNWTF